MLSLVLNNASIILFDIKGVIRLGFKIQVNYKNNKEISSMNVTITNEIELLKAKFERFLQTIKSANDALTVKKNSAVQSYQNIIKSLHNLTNQFNSTIVNEGVFTYANNLAYEADNKIFSTLTSHLLADLAVLAGYAYFGASQSAVTEYAISSGLKYLPNLAIEHVFKNQDSTPINSLLTSNYAPLALETAYLAWSYLKGEKDINAIITALGWEVGGLVGGIAGDKIGEVGANFTNAVLQPIYATFNQRNSTIRPMPSDGPATAKPEDRQQIVINGNLTINQTINNYLKDGDYVNSLPKANATLSQGFPENFNKYLSNTITPSLSLFNPKKPQVEDDNAQILKNESNNSMPELGLNKVT